MSVFACFSWLAWGLFVVFVSAPCSEGRKTCKASLLVIRPSRLLNAMIEEKIRNRASSVSQKKTKNPLSHYLELSVFINFTSADIFGFLELVYKECFLLEYRIGKMSVCLSQRKQRDWLFRQRKTLKTLRKTVIF